MYHSVYGYTKIVSPRGIDITIKIRNKEKTQIYGNYNIKLKIITEIDKCTIVDEIPIECNSDDTYTLPSTISNRLSGYYYIIFILTDKTSGEIQEDRSRLIITE